MSRFQLLKSWGSIAPVERRIGARQNKRSNMKNLIVLAVTLGVIAPAALLLSFRSLVTPELVVGYYTVMALLAVAALEYGVNWKRLFGR